ncbi:MAG: dual specificity protein phosphatase [Candidatus Sulfotelmatobacter sp.]
MKRGSWSSGETNWRAGLSVSPRVGSRRGRLPDNDGRLDGYGSGSIVIDGAPVVEYLRNLRAKVRAGNDVSLTRRRFGMDITWVTDRIAVGGGIWTANNMAAVSRAGITHIIDMQIEFDDTPLAEPHGIVVCWNPVDDDFEPKPPDVFARGVEFALAALEENGAKLFIHCAAGVHRAPMMTLALLGVMGWTVEDAMDLIEKLRPAADFAEVYVRSVERFLNGRR